MRPFQIGAWNYAESCDIYIYICWKVCLLIHKYTMTIIFQHDWFWLLTNCPEQWGIFCHLLHESFSPTSSILPFQIHPKRPRLSRLCTWTSKCLAKLLSRCHHLHHWYVSSAVSWSLYRTRFLQLQYKDLLARTPKMPWVACVCFLHLLRSITFSHSQHNKKATSSPTSDITVWPVEWRHILVSMHDVAMNKW